MTRFEIAFTYRARGNPRHTPYKVVLQAESLESAITAFKGQEHRTRNGWIMRRTRMRLRSVIEV